MMITGLSAFPLTPIKDDTVDDAAFGRLIERLVSANVDSITALGSTGSYAYLSIQERARVAELAVEQAQHVPVFVGVGALRTSDVLTHAENAQQAGASGLIVAPMSYQSLTQNEVYSLFHTVTQNSSVPVIVYDNPGTTRFTFSNELYARVAALPGVASIKIPPVSSDLHQARARITDIRALIPEHVTIGISGDPTAVTGLLAGCDVWYSVLAGTLPQVAQSITGPALNGRSGDAMTESQRLDSLWDLFVTHGSLRTVATIAEHLGLTEHPSLPAPLKGLPHAQREQIREVVETLGLLR